MVQKSMQKSKLIKKSREDERFFSVLGDMAKVSSALSNEDSLKIFYAAKDGIESSTKAIKEMGLTQKRYYTRLKELLEVGLLQKEDNVYRYTTLGKLCFKLGELLGETLSHGEQLELIDRVSSSPNLSSTEKETVIQALASEGLTQHADLLSGGINRIGVVTNFDDVNSLTMRLVESTEKKLYLATRYTDVNVADTILECLNRGAEMYFLDGDRQNLSTRTQLLRMVLSNPLKIRKFYQLFHSSNVHVKYCDLPFSFIVSDEKYVGFELTNPHTDKFIVGLFLEDKMLAKRFIEIFEGLYANAQEDPLKAFSKNLKTLKPDQ